MNSASLDRRVRLHVQGPERDFRAICHPGFEPVLAQELAALGIAGVCDCGAVDFRARFAEVCAAQAMLRTASRVLLRVHAWHAENFGQLEKGLAAIPWELYLPAGCVPEVEVHCRKSRLFHSDAVATRAVKVLADKLASAAAPLTVPVLPQRVLLRLFQDRCQVSVDLSGDLLYKRGYGRYTEEAPLRETMAAAILLAARLPLYDALIDPMAGSGVFSIEAAQWCHGRLPGVARSFACQEQPAFRAAAFAHALRHPRKPFVSGPARFLCADRDAKACATASRNVSWAGLDAWVQPQQQDFFTLSAPDGPHLLVLNPPYGKRLKTNPVALFREIGKKIRADFSRSACAIICPGVSCRQALGIEPQRVVQSVNGGIPVEVVFRDA